MISTFAKMILNVIQNKIFIDESLISEMKINNSNGDGKQTKKNMQRNL